MIPVKVGAVTTDVECPPVEQALGVVTGLGHAMYGLASAVEAIAMLSADIDKNVSLVRDAVAGAPRIVFAIGPVSEQE